MPEPHKTMNYCNNHNSDFKFRSYFYYYPVVITEWIIFRKYNSEKCTTM